MNAAPGLWLRELGARTGSSNSARHTGASLPMALLMIALRGLLAIPAARRFRVVNNDIDHGQGAADRGLTILVTCLVAVLALAMMGYLLLT